NKLQRYEEAIPFAMEGIEKARADGNPNLSMELWITLGESYNKKGNLDEAEICLQSALEWENKVSKKYLIASVYTQLGLLYLEQENYKLSNSTLNKAVRIYKDINDAFRLIDALIAYGR